MHFSTIKLHCRHFKHKASLCIGIFICPCKIWVLAFSLVNILAEYTIRSYTYNIWGLFFASRVVEMSKYHVQKLMFYLLASDNSGFSIGKSAKAQSTVLVCCAISVKLCVYRGLRQSLMW